MPAYQPPTVTFRITLPGLNYGEPSYNDIEVIASSFPLGYTLGFHDGWCADASTAIFNGSTYVAATVYSSYEYNIIRANAHFSTLGDVGGTLLPGTSVPVDGLHSSQPFVENLDIVNWLLNNIQVSGSSYNDIVDGIAYSNIPYYTVDGISGSYTYGDIQQTIWQLLGDGWSSNSFIGVADPARVTTLVNGVVAHDGYIPDVGEKIAVILDVQSSAGLVRQPLITQTIAAKLGDYVWNDRNANGIQDDGETGINGATVNLWRDLNGNGVRDGANELLATTTTHTNGNDGYYEFKGLTPGLEYQVEFVQPTGLIGVSAANQGSSTALDSNGVKQSGQINSEKIYLNPGDFNQTIDQGFYNSFDNLVPKASLGRLRLD
jgi:hypothetical protein